MLSSVVDCMLVNLSCLFYILDILCLALTLFLIREVVLVLGLSCCICNLMVSLSLSLPFTPPSFGWSACIVYVYWDIDGFSLFLSFSLPLGFPSTCLLGCLPGRLCWCAMERNGTCPLSCVYWFTLTALTSCHFCLFLAGCAAFPIYVDAKDVGYVLGQPLNYLLKA